jgi:hypothetical protein
MKIWNFGRSPSFKATKSIVLLDFWFLMHEIFLSQTYRCNTILVSNVTERFTIYLRTFWAEHYVREAPPSCDGCWKCGKLWELIVEDLLKAVGKFNRSFLWMRGICFGILMAEYWCWNLLAKDLFQGLFVGKFNRSFLLMRGICFGILMAEYWCWNLLAKDLFQGLFVKGYSTPIEGIRCGLSSILFDVLCMNVSFLHLSPSRVVAE